MKYWINKHCNIFHRIKNAFKYVFNLFNKEQSFCLKKIDVEELQGLLNRIIEVNKVEKQKKN